MKTSSKLLSVFAAGAFAFAVPMVAQIQTYETVSNYSGTSNYSLTSGGRAGQTFSNIYAIQSLTYNFFGAPGVDTTLSATFAQWNGAGGFAGAFNANNYTTIHNFGTFTVNQFVSPNSNGWTQITNTNGTFNTFAVTFDFTNLAADSETETAFFETNPSTVYALILHNATGSTTPFGLGFANDTFAFGEAGIGLGSFSQDYTFSQISVATNAIPESSTIASLIAVGLVAGLVTFRIRQRRQPLPAAAVSIPA